MRALLLAAGLGTRLRPLTDTVPKCLISINGISLLDIWLSLLREGKIERVLVNTHYLADIVSAHIHASPWRQYVDLIHEVSLLGTGGTVLANQGFFLGQAGLIAHADNLTCFDVRAFIAQHDQRPAGTEITMMTFHTDSPRSCGIVEQDGRGVVTGFYEKVLDPPGTLANGAVYIFEPVVFDFMNGLGKSVVDISTDVLPNFLGRIQTHENMIYHRDVGTPESLRQAMLEYPDVLDKHPEFR
jgi:mannose-1-phosphate guanylyltransferase